MMKSRCAPTLQLGGCDFGVDIDRATELNVRRRFLSGLIQNIRREIGGKWGLSRVAADPKSVGI